MKRKPYSKYKDSGVQWLGKVPEHWEVRRLKTFTSIRYGVGEPPEYKEEGFLFVRATDVSHGKIFLEGMKKISRDDVP
jgi:type I restriction enzyme S subunit